MKLTKLFIAAFVVLTVVSCRVNPFTGEKNLALVSDTRLFPMAFQQYDKFLNKHQIITGTQNAKMVRRVGQKIARAAQQLLRAKGYPHYLDDFKWEYHLVKDDQANAWCMPGGKIVVYSGILPITQDEAGLAVVLGHEVSHALLNHGQRRMSQAQIRQLTGVAGSVALSGSEAGQLFNKYYGITTQLGIMLPFSRKFESQADKLGLTLMAIAGYDPQEAVELWQRMSQQGGAQPPVFLSTHPSNQMRINDIRQWVDEAKATARKFGVTSFQK